MPAWRAWCGMAAQAWLGQARPGTARRGLAGQRRQRPARRGQARHGGARQGSARHAARINSTLLVFNDQQPSYQFSSRLALKAASMLRPSKPWLVSRKHDESPADGGG